jgi:hypothetical protein
MIDSLKHINESLRRRTLKKYVLPLRGDACTNIGSTSEAIFIGDLAASGQSLLLYLGENAGKISHL